MKYIYPLIILLLSYACTKTNKPYQLLEFEKKVGDVDSVLMYTHTYNENKQLVSTIDTTFDKNEKITKLYFYSPNGMVKEIWSTPKRGNYFTIHYRYKDGKLHSSSENYNNQLLDPYEKFFYNSEGKLIRKILFAKDTLTDIETEYQYEGGKLVTRKLYLGTVYGQSNYPLLWYENHYSYTKEDSIYSVETIHFSKEGNSYEKSENTYNEDGEKIKTVYYNKIKAAYTPISTTFYYKKELEKIPY